MRPPRRGDHTIEAVARLVNTSTDTIRREIRRGRLDAYRVGRLVRITDESLERYKQRGIREYRREMKGRNGSAA